MTRGSDVDDFSSGDDYRLDGDDDCDKNGCSDSGGGTSYTGTHYIGFADFVTEDMSSGAGRNGSIAESTPDVGADSGISISISGGYGVNNTLNLGNTYGSLTAPAITTSNKSVLKFVNNQPKTFSVTIENTTGTDFVLEKIYYDWGLPNANAGETLTLRTADDTVVLTHTVATAVGTYDIDKDIEDLTIAANSTVTLTGTVTGFANNGPQSRLDNLLFEGTYAAAVAAVITRCHHMRSALLLDLASVDSSNAVALQIDSQAAQEVAANVTTAGTQQQKRRGHGCRSIGHMGDISQCS